MAKNQTEAPPQTTPPSDVGKEEMRKLYEEEIARLKDGLVKAWERTKISQIGSEKRREKIYEKFIKPLEQEIAAKEAEMRHALGGAPAPKAKTGEESEELKLKSSWEKAQKEKREKKEEARKQKEKTRVEKKRATIEKFKSRLSPQEQLVSLEQEKSDEKQEEKEAKNEEESKESKPWEIEALERAQEELEKGRKEYEEWKRKEKERIINEEELEKEKKEREEETAKLVKEAEERDREENERKEKWPSNVARAIDKAHSKFEEAKHDTNKLSRLQDLRVDVEYMTKTYQSLTQQGRLPLPEEESRLLQLKRDIENELESMAKVEESRQEPQQEEQPQTPLETKQAREKKIAAFRARRAELERKNKEEGWDSDEDFQKFGMESYDRGTAEHYNFDIKKIDEAIEEAKKEKNPRYREQSIERLQRAKALIEKEIGVGMEVYEIESRKDAEPLARKTGENIIIEDMKSPEGAFAPEPEKEPDKALQKPKEKQYTEKDSVEGWKHYIAKEEERQESPKMETAVNKLLGEELRNDVHMREAAVAVVGARRAMRGALATRKEERLYAEAGAGFIAPERLQEAERIEKTYEDALVGLSARLRESAGNNDEAFLVPYLNIQNAEAMRIAEMREAALTPERRNIAVRFYQRLNNPFNRDVPPRWARYVRVGLTAAVLGGGSAALGGAGALGIATYAGWRMGTSLAYMAANGIARSGIDMALTRHADTMMGEERGRQRTAMQEALRNNERVATLQESLRASIRGFQSEAAAQLENRKFYGRAATFGLMGLSGLISYELARPSVVAADKGAFGGHVATNEDALRQRFYGALDRVQEGTSATKQRIEDIAGTVTARVKELYNSGLSYGESLAKSAEEAAAKAETYVFGGKSSAEVIEDVIGKGGADSAAEAARKAAEAVGETTPSGGGITPPEVEPPSAGISPEEAAEELRRARGGLPPHESIEEVQKRMEGGSRATEILTDEQREEALKQYYGLVESAEKDRLAYLEKKLTEGVLTDEQREEALKRYYGLVEAAEADRPPSLMTPEQAAELHELQEKGVLSDEQIETLKRNWEGRPPLLTPEEMEKLRSLREKGVLTDEQINHLREAWEGKLEAVAKDPIATIGKGGNIWEASRSLIGEGEGKISKEQWLEAWEKSGLADKGFVKSGATVRFDAAEGLLKVSEAKENEFLYQALQKESKPIPDWLEDWRDVKEGRPSAAEVVKESADRIVARPAAPPHEVLENPVAGAKGGTFEQLLQDKAAQEYYVDSFGRWDFAKQEEVLGEVKNAAKHLETNIEENAHSSVRAAYEQEVAQTNSFINRLENNTDYQGNLRAWEALGKEWVRKVGVSDTQFEELSNEWTVERFLDTAKKIENRDFVPSDHLSKVLEARRMGTLEMAERIRSELPDRSALKMPLGRFLKNTL